MIRKLYCPTCAVEFTLYLDDRAQGYQFRKVEIPKVKTPEDLLIRTIEHKEGHTYIQDEPQKTLRCDLCGLRVVDGLKMVAITMWNINREDEPGPWEKEFSQ